VERCFQFTVAWTRSVLSIGLNDCRLGFHGYRYHGINQFLQYYASEFTYPPRVLNAYGKVAYLRRMVASSRTLSQFAHHSNHWLEALRCSFSSGAFCSYLTHQITRSTVPFGGGPDSTQQCGYCTDSHINAQVWLWFFRAPMAATLPSLLTVGAGGTVRGDKLPHHASPLQHASSV